jgi:diguanylate cyclase (GGDEF)-like protein
MRKLSFLARFAIMGAIPTLVLSVFLGKSLQADIRESTLESTKDQAVLASHLGIEPLVSEGLLDRGVSGASEVSLHRALDKPSISRVIQALTIYNRSGQVVYSHDRAGLRSKASESTLDRALRGRTISTVVEEGTHSYQIFVPLHRAGGSRPEGVMQISMPYGPIAEEIQTESRNLLIVLLVGLTVLYAALFRIVAHVSEKLRFQVAENEHQAMHDALTGLPNRTLFHDRVNQAILAGHRTNEPLAVMIMDLDRFKEINDTLGHHNGDGLLKQLGPRIAHSLRESDTIARLGGDEFAVLLPTVQGEFGAPRVAEKIRKTLRKPFNLDGITLEVEASVGIAYYPEHGTDVETLMQRADIAMYQAKEGHTGHAVYAVENDQHSTHRLALAGELRRAIDNRELVVYYQPKAELATGRITSVEALLRWEHPEHGLMTPDKFIPLAEHTELIGPLTHYVLEAALKQARVWHDDGLKVGVAINLSARSLLDLQFPGVVAELISKWRVEPRYLTFEITESTIMSDTSRSMEVLGRLSGMGFGIAVDDFGAGYSSLAYLKKLPVDELKIDKSFVMNMANNENDAVIVQSTIDLGKNLGLKIVAEGVETEAVWDQLNDLGCNLAQGFYVSPAIPAEALSRSFHEAWRSRHSAATRVGRMQRVALT